MRPRKAHAPTGSGSSTRPVMVDRKMASSDHAWCEESRERACPHGWRMRLSSRLQRHADGAGDDEADDDAHRHGDERGDELGADGGRLRERMRE